MKKKSQISKGLLLFLFFFPVVLLAQETITGKVINEGTGEGVPFINIVEDGTSNGTASDIDGNFSLTVSNLPVTLRVFSIGFTTKKVNVDNAGAITIQVEESLEALDEIVVTGLGSSIKRKNLANAVSTVSSEELVGNTSQTTVDGALYGKVTGVNITASSGAPGGGFALRLRGISSINGNNQPLIIVDGVYINNVEIPSGLRFASGGNRGNEENSGNRLADLDPNDIENIEVLKGSSAAAIYGQRGNAGVVIITTKRGKGGRTKISFSQDTGITVIQNRLGLRPWTAQSVEDTFDATERQRFEDAIANGGLIDYEDEIYGNTGFITDTRLNVTGGNEKTQFYVGGSFRDEEGIIKNTGFDRLSLRANIDHKISDVFDFTSTTNFVRSNSSRSFTGNENEGGLSYGYTLAFTRPWVNLFPDANGNYPNNPNYPGNPLFVRDQAKNEDTNNRIIQGFKLNTKLFTNERNRVRFLINGGIDYLANETYVFVPKEHQAQVGGQEGFISQGKNNFTQINAQAIAIWDHDMLGDDLDLTTQLGITYLDQEANLVNSRGSDLSVGQTNVDQSVNQVIDQFLSSEEDFGYFGQIEANYKNQFIATLGYRLDKSSRNGDPNEFYGFPKASLAVNVSSFDFWNIEAMNQLKLRAAYGETGNPAAFGATFTSLGSSNIGGNGGSSVAGLNGDPDVEPETASEFEVGFDLGFLNSRVSLEATYYNKNVKDLILSRSLPASSGFTTETTNLADLKNEGVELALRADVLDSDNFYWNTGIQFYLNRSEVTRLDVPAFAQPGAGFGTGLGTFFIEEGQPVTQLVGNIDGTLTQVGNVEPDFQMAFNNQLTLFKQWDVSFLLQWKKGGDNLNLSRFLTDLGGTSPDLETPEGQARLATPANAERFVEPAGYVRLREAAIYYRISSDNIKSLFGDTVSDIKLGLSGRNLFTITDYSSYDPEVSVNGGAGLSSGIEVTPFPSSQQFYLHLNVNF
ncbi:SusC/RagA family TonB-linked outer membrane protein [Aquimarina sp. BL5]|uniref:SusC/RagA family TonB-linked outer membrane protein n=1 Tax=Aquimarina sp. BL5 TaxID=1714860 RepID=UPI000E49CC64|nr:SusC/RagA family TonB-linked outer membrane protein [Aquimarina sp. BL5]AXT51555.1 SusC/RagA family TonB-linked outer membrane protein [Aquimarina sp. BL5]RKN09154.1 SusC/RagA family TonB-linked outer membrane protein [Aquimarina sp. BL5]